MYATEEAKVKIAALEEQARAAVKALYRLQVEEVRKERDVPARTPVENAADPTNSTLAYLALQRTLKFVEQKCQ